MADSLQEVEKNLDPRGARPGFGSRRSTNITTVTVEVRRKKLSLLDKRKALGGGERHNAQQKEKKIQDTLGLTSDEVDARLKALRGAAQRTQEEKEAQEKAALLEAASRAQEETGEIKKTEEVAKAAPAQELATPPKETLEGTAKKEKPRKLKAEPPKEGPIVPVILRAASYGPSPQQIEREKEKEREKLKKKEQEKSEQEQKSGLARHGLERKKEDLDVPLLDGFKGRDTKAAPTGRFGRPRKTSEDSDDGSRSFLRKAAGPLSRKLSRTALSRVLADEDEMRARSVASYRRAQKRRLSAGQQKETQHVIRDVLIPDFITVGELSNRMAVSSAIVIKSLMKLGTLTTINQQIDGDTAELLCVEFGHKPKRVSRSDFEIGIRRDEDRSEDLQPRPPVITVMGHVDHGKTSLLDALRRTDVLSTEHGGITQHIGAYQIVTSFSDEKITFLDTPGHSAFSEMRARGANVTDIVVLVVAADDSVNAQTIEAISHAKDANAPLVVAVNKIDKPAANPQNIRNELLSHDVVVEDFGGSVIAVDISAKTGKNLDKLVEAILLQAEMMELRANPDGPAEGTIIESSLEKGRGIVATVLIQRGTLRPGDIFVAGTEFGRVKTMNDSYKKKVAQAGPSFPVEVLGFNGIPRAGDRFSVVATEAKAREVAENRRQIRREQRDTQGNNHSAESLLNKIAASDMKELAIVLKADTQGSLEAITSSISKLVVNDVVSNVIYGAVGDINETDVMLAKTSHACVMGFNIKATPQARVLSEQEGVPVGHYNIIYEMFDRIESMMKGLLAPKFEEHSLGKAELRVVFSKGKFIKIAGCYVLSGLIRRSNAQIRVHRGTDILFTGKMESMKHEQDDIKEAKEGHECGIILEGFNNLEKGDILECFEIVEVAPV
ncbi:translation initiation factor IF-2 [Alphaproteobacteria bacterium]|nr:translation initiation factor IF-2 [Alphaproteobacteria bacterium]GHS95987.1 translation initiation factor IF-2 [Alphaproteobacteria bacterium]